jgi:hypothetical protein
LLLLPLLLTVAYTYNMRFLRSEYTGNAGSGAVATTLGLSYALVRECAMTVWERSYPDEEGQLVPRWKLNKTTKALKFSHKWVVGLLKRVQQSRDGGEFTCCLCLPCILV